MSTLFRFAAYRTAERWTDVVFVRRSQARLTQTVRPPHEGLRCGITHRYIQRADNHSMPKSLRYIVALSLAIATVLCATPLQLSKEDRSEQDLKRLLQQLRDLDRDLERTPREMWRQ